MKLIPAGGSKLLTLIAAAAACAALYMSGNALAELADFLRFYSSNLFYPALAHSKLPAEMPPLAALMSRHMLASFWFSFLFWLSAAALAVGVLLRREWARRGAVAMCYLLAGAGLMMLAFPWLVVPRPLVYGGVELAPDFNSVVRAAALLVRVTSLCGGALCLWWALALDRGAVRGEFVRKV
mgnify:FL=1